MFEEGQNETLGYHKELISTIVLVTSGSSKALKYDFILRHYIMF